jgi:hypothetical protein
MSSSRLTYSDVLVKQRVESWAENLDFDPEEQMVMLLEDKFGVGQFTVFEARPVNDFIMLTVEADVWVGVKEFALLSTGSLAW